MRYSKIDMSRQNPIIHAHLARKKHITFFDKVIILASFLYPLCSVPQVIQVFNGQTSGVSLLSWAGFTVFAVLFFSYGLIHRITPMIITNAIWFIVDALVIIGLLTHLTVIS